jgi:hypothetical protein
MSQRAIYSCDGCGATIRSQGAAAYVLVRGAGPGLAWRKLDGRLSDEHRLLNETYALSGLMHACSRECAVKIADEMRDQLEKL